MNVIELLHNNRFEWGGQLPIRVLAPDVATKIAAGEVVERPASVAKELIENAIDAGARQLRIEIRDGGLQLVRVIDDGHGIAPEELETAFQRHATSKISSTDDLFSIATLGFRGEALPSIAAVADVTLVTRPADQLVGSFIRMRDGLLVEQGKRGCAAGTMISVQNLFSNVPARLKFLNGSVNEGSRVANVISQYAMAYPEIKFSLVNNGRLAFQSTGSGELRDVLAKVYSVDVAAAMLPVIVEGDTQYDITIHGYVSPPNVTRATRAYLSFFVNGRWIRSRLLSYAIEEAYHTLLPVGRHPIAVVNIKLPATDLDVNVHPGKTEIKFLREREVFTHLQRAVRQVLTDHLTIPVVVNRAAAISSDIQHHFQPTWDGVVVANSRQESPSAVPEAPQLPALSASMNERLPILRVLGQSANTLIVAEGPEGIYLIDQHRAHERVLYEQLMDEQKRSAVHTQLLLEPLTVELTARQMTVLPDRMEGLASVGFSLEQFGDLAILVRAVPALLTRPDLSTAIRELLDQAVDDRASSDWLERMAITLACHGAIKSGQPLSLTEMRELVMQLEKTSIPPTCPHGSPTMVHLSQAQLKRQFGRE